MNKFLIIIITVLILVGAIFGYRYYQSNQTTKEITNITSPTEKVVSNEPSKESKQSEKLVSQKMAIEEIAKKFENNGRKINYSQYPLYKKEETLIVIASVSTDMSAAECVFSNKNGSWEEIGCHQNLLPCEMLDKAGMDRQTTIEFKCFDYDKQEYRLTDSSYKNNVTFKEETKFVEIKDSKNKYSIKFANDYKLDVTDRYSGYNMKHHGQRINKKRLDFKKTGENFKLIYFPEYITPATGGWGGGFEYQYEIESFSGKMGMDKLKINEGQIGGYTVIGGLEKLTINGKEAYRFYSPSGANGVNHTIIVINENHYLMFTSYFGDADSSYNKLYNEMINSLKFE